MVRTDDLTEATPGVFYTNQSLVAVDKGVVDLLKVAAAETPLKRARLCAHPSPDASQHDMLIVSLRETYVAPHRHLANSETMLVIEGLAETVLFDDSGGITQSLSLGAIETSRLFFYRMPERVFHSLLIESEMLVFVESTKGPFRAEDSQNAPWAPPPQDEAAGFRYKQWMLSEVRRLKISGAKPA